MSNFNRKFGTAMTPEQYAMEWKVSSEIFRNQQHYTWMASQANNGGNILEIGCGSGDSTLELAKNNWRVFAVESNFVAISNAMKLLQENNISIEVIYNPSTWNITSCSSQVTILHKDFMDHDMESMLPLKFFDAIACWLIGSNPDHIGFHLMKESSNFDGSELPLYRQTIERKCYSIGKMVLKEQGIVHVIDRLGIPSWNDKDIIREQFASIQTDLSNGGYSISKKDCILRRIGDALHSSGIQYVTEAHKMKGTPLTVFASSIATLSS